MQRISKVFIGMMWVVLICSWALGACQRTDFGKAQRSAEDYSKHIEGTTSVLCAQTDTDGDGYVSCTVFRSKSEEPLQIQCGSERFCIWNCAEGCKYVPTMKMGVSR